MAYTVGESISVTTDSGGDATVYSSDTYNGRIQNVIYTKTDFANGVDFTITTEDTGQNVWVESDVNASATRAPRQPTHDTTGGAESYDGTNPVNDYIWMHNERLKIVVGSGGNAKSGSFRLIVG